MSSYSRQACAQKIEIKEDGFIPQVEINGKDWEIIIDPSENWVKSSIDINLLGVLPLYLTYSGQNNIDLITISFK